MSLSKRTASPSVSMSRICSSARPLPTLRPFSTRRNPSTCPARPRRYSMVPSSLALSTTMISIRHVRMAQEAAEELARVLQPVERDRGNGDAVEHAPRVGLCRVEGEELGIELTAPARPGSAPGAYLAVRHGRPTARRTRSRAASTRPLIRRRTAARSDGTTMPSGNSSATNSAQIDRVSREGGAERAGLHPDPCPGEGQHKGDQRRNPRVRVRHRPQRPSPVRRPGVEQEVGQDDGRRPPRRSRARARARGSAPLAARRRPRICAAIARSRP